MVLGLFAVVAACGGGEPQHLTFDLEIAERGLVGDAIITVKQDDTVTLSVSVDEPGELHVHGYEHEIELSPDAPASVTFLANATGRFNLSLHVAAEAEQHDANGEPASELDAGPEGHHEEGEAKEQDHDSALIEIVIGALEVQPR